MQVGSYVVCIDDTNWDKRAFVEMSKLPKKNIIYQVRRLIDGFGEEDNAPGIALVGIYGNWKEFIDNYGQKVFEEYHFKIKRFREIESPESFVESILEKIENECTIKI